MKKIILICLLFALSACKNEPEAGDIVKVSRGSYGICPTKSDLRHVYELAGIYDGVFYTTRRWEYWEQRECILNKEIEAELVDILPHDDFAVEIEYNDKIYYATRIEKIE